MLASLGAWMLGRIAAWGLSGIVAQVTPIIVGIVKLGGAVISAVAEIIMALARSPEGRVVLGLALGALAFLYVRFHYIEQGKSQGDAAGYSRGVLAGKASLKCSGAQPPRKR